MENMEIVFCAIDLLDHNDRLYVAKCGDHEFEFVAQYWDGETGRFTGTDSDAYMMHNGPKNPDDTAQWFTESPAWDVFEAATGVTPEAFLEAFEELIEDEAAKADDDDEFHGIEKLPAGKHHLFAAPPAPSNGRTA